MAKVSIASVDDYLAAQPAETRAVLARVRAIFRKALPGAEERISYKIPAYRVHGYVALFFAGWEEHFSVYPVGDALREHLGAELELYQVSKGTLRFPLDKPPPARLLTRIAKLRAAEAGERAAKKTARRPATGKKATRKAAAKRALSETMAAQKKSAKKARAAKKAPTAKKARSATKARAAKKAHQ